MKCYRKKNKKFKTDVITSSILLLAQPGLGAQNGYDQPRYQVHRNLRVETVKTQWLTLDEWGTPYNNVSKLAVGQPTVGLTIDD